MQAFQKKSLTQDRTRVDPEMILLVSNPLLSLPNVRQTYEALTALLLYVMGVSFCRWWHVCAEQERYFGTIYCLQGTRWRKPR